MSGRYILATTCLLLSILFGHTARSDDRAAPRDGVERIEVPMLPTEPYRYAFDNVPSHISAATLQSMDNTPPDNPITDAGAALGRVLFYDRRLSTNDTIACVSCHRQEKAFADPRQFGRGFEAGDTNRNAMSLVNLRYTVLRGTHPGFFWDERAPTLEAQVLMPIQDNVEMGMELPALVDSRAFFDLPCGVDRAIDAVFADEQMTWRSWWDDILDATGVIRYKNISPESVDAAIERLVAELDGE